FDWAPPRRISSRVRTGPRWSLCLWPASLLGGNPTSLLGGNDVARHTFRNAGPIGSTGSLNPREGPRGRWPLNHNGLRDRHGKPQLDAAGQPVFRSHPADFSEP